jgi:hypothetical protein
MKNAKLLKRMIKKILLKSYESYLNLPNSKRNFFDRKIKQ